MWYQHQQREKPQPWNFTPLAAFGHPAWCNKRAHTNLLSETLLPCLRIANTCKTLCKYLITSCNVTERRHHSQPSPPSLSWAGIAKVALCLHFLWAYATLLFSVLQNSLVTDEIACRDDRTQCRSSHSTLGAEPRVAVGWGLSESSRLFEPHVHAKHKVMIWYLEQGKTPWTLEWVCVCIQNWCSFTP